MAFLDASSAVSVRLMIRQLFVQELKIVSFFGITFSVRLMQLILATKEEKHVASEMIGSDSVIAQYDGDI